MMGRLAVVVLVGMCTLSAYGCAARSETSVAVDTNETAPDTPAAATASNVTAPDTPAAATASNVTEAFVLVAPSIPPGEDIPARYTCDGDDVSPALAWSGVPSAAKSLALSVVDPDAGGFVHWLVYAIPPSATSLPEAIPAEGETAGGLRQGVNSFGQVGYGGPCPPGGTHHYVFRLIALDVSPELAGGSDESAFLKAVQGHILGEAALTLAYTRP